MAKKEPTPPGHSIAKSDLLAALNRVKAALAAKSQLVGLASIWFENGRVWAYNDQLGIEEAVVPPGEPDFTFQGGLPGSLILGFVGGASDELIEFSSSEGSSILVRSGASKLKTPRIEMERLPWRFPDVDVDSLFTVPEGFAEALTRVMFGVGKPDQTNPETAGITLIPNPQMGRTSIYTTDRVSLTWTWFEGIEDHPSDGPFSPRITFTQEFCNQFLNMSSLASDIKLGVHEGASVALFGDGGPKLFGKLIGTGRPLNFDGIIQGALEDGYEDRLIQIPLDFKDALDRALLVATTEEPYIRITVSGEFLKIEAASPIAGIDEEIQIGPGHPEISVETQAKLLRRAISQSDKMAILPSCLVFTMEEVFIHIVSTRQR